MSNKNLLTSQTLPMNASEWRLRLAELCRDCAGAEASEEAEHLRRALRLMAMAPDDEMGAMVDHLPPQAALEALLGLGAFESAAMALLPEHTTYLLSRSATGDYLASVLLAQVDEEMTSQGATMALAMVSALLASLSTMERQVGLGLAMEDEEEDAEAAAFQIPAGARLH
jgi:hypothetical protein